MRKEDYARQKRRRRLDMDLKDNVKKLANLTTQNYIKKIKEGTSEKGELADLVKLLGFVKDAGLGFNKRTTVKKAEPGEDPFQGVELKEILSEMDEANSGADG